MSFSIAIATLMIMTTSFAVGGDVLRIDNGNVRHRLPLRAINGIEYVEFEALARAIGQYQKPDVCIVQGYRIRWSAPGFFAIISTAQIYQSIHPALLRESKLFVPLDDYMELLYRVGVIEWNSAHRLARIRRYSQQSRENDFSPQPTVPRGYLLPPRLRRPSLEKLQNQSHSIVQRVSPLLASTEQWVSTVADSINRVVRIIPQFSGDTTRIRILLSTDLPTEYVELHQHGTQIRVHLSGVRCDRSVLEPLAKVRLRGYNAERRENTSIITMTLRRTDRIARLYHATARQIVVEISPRAQLHPAVQRWALDCIVVDPGHGGRDVGAIGLGGIQEKNITLAVARRIARLLRSQIPSVRVVLTRDRDHFVALHRRCEMANAAGGKLFLSLHCNAAPTKPHPARGVEVYVLSPARTDEAAAVAARENASIQYESDSLRYQSVTIQQQILATVAQHGFLELSHRLAQLLDSTMNVVLQQPTRGVQSAGFLVLVGAAMPSVLIEMGFLTHPEEAQLLQRSAYQEKIARAIVQAVLAYVRQYEQMVVHHGRNQ